MTYRDRIDSLAATLGARLDIRQDFDPEWTVARIEDNEPDYPVSPHERARGWVVTGYADMIERRVTVNGWNEDTEPEAFAVALHELGHIATSPTGIVLDPWENFAFAFLGITPAVIQKHEKQAWEWAVQHITPDVLDAAVTKSGVALRSYGIEHADIEGLHARMRRAAQSHQ